MRALAERWRNAYDWRTYEAELNSYPQFGRPHPDRVVGVDAFLTNLSILWFTGTIGLSMRFYTEGEQWGASTPDLLVDDLRKFFAAHARR